MVEAVRTHALVGLDTAGLTEVTVTRASRGHSGQGHRRRRSRGRSPAQYALGAAKDITVNFDRELRAMQVTPSAIGEPRVARINYDARSGRFDADARRADRRRTPRHAAASAAAPWRPLEVVVLAHAVDARRRAARCPTSTIERRPRAEVGRDGITRPRPGRSALPRATACRPAGRCAAPT